MSRRQRLTLLAAIIGSGIASIDGSIVNVALPSIERSLGGGLTVQQWITSGYLLTLGSLIIVGGSLGDRFGEARVFRLGVAGFGACSLICAIAPSSGVLLGARALQGVAGALLVPSSLAAIVAAFPGPERSAAIGTWTAWGSIAQVVGPLLGGLIVAHASWRWIFAVNLPFCLVTIALIAAALPPSTPTPEARPRPHLDLLGAGLCVLGLGALVFALTEQPRLGWGSPAILAPLVLGPVGLGLFVAHESRTPDPMVDLALFRERNFSVANLQTLAMYAGLGGLIFFLQVFLQQVAGYAPLSAGLSTLPITLLMFALSRRFGALAARRGPRRFMGAGPLIAAVGILLLLRAGRHTSYPEVLLPALVVFAIGLAATVAPLTATVLAAAEARNAGIASGVNNAIARIGGLLAVSLLGLVAAGALGPGDSFRADAAGVHAFRLVMAVCAGLVGAGGLIGALGLRS